MKQFGHDLMSHNHDWIGICELGVWGPRGLQFGRGKGGFIRYQEQLDIRSLASPFLVALETPLAWFAYSAGVLLLRSQNQFGNWP